MPAPDPSPTPPPLDSSPDLTKGAELPRPPKWLLPRESRLRKLLHVLSSLLSPSAARLLRLLRPRLTKGFILVVLPTLYVLACVLVFKTPPFSFPLPAYAGPHGVGTMDIEVPLAQPKLTSDSVFRDSGAPAFELQTVLFTLYYPTERGYRSPHPRHYWVPRPVGLTARGFARFLHADIFLVRQLLTFLLWATAGGITIPAEVDAPLLSSDELGGKAQFPLVVFSHGTTSSRTDYSHLMGELASRGAIVAAIEHRDGSCPGSLIIRNTSSGVLEHQDRLFFQESDLLLPNKSSMTTPQFKIEQLAFRDAEFAATLSALHTLHTTGSLASSRPEGRHLHTFAHRIDTAKVIIAGHSYGATSALQFLRQTLDSSPPPSSSLLPAAGLVLDPGKSSGPLNDNVNVPLLILQSTSWSATNSIFFGRPHCDTVKDIATGVLRRHHPAWFLTSLGTSHPSVTDAPLLQPLLLSWTTGAGLDVRGALRQYVNVSDDFVRFLLDGKPRGVLVQPVTHPEYGQWIDEDRKKSYPAELAKLWEVHVSPAPLDEDHPREADSDSKSG